MYHRYMPMENGVYQRKVMPDSRSEVPHAQRNPSDAPAQRQEMDSLQQQRPIKPPPQTHTDEKQAVHEKESRNVGTQEEQHASSYESFDRNRIPILEKLLPGMDSGDILVLLILLFLISEGNEDSSSVIMTLAIFLFLQ